MDRSPLRLPETFDDRVGYWTATPDWDALERALAAVVGDAAPWREGLRRLSDAGETLTVRLPDAQIVITADGRVDVTDAALAERLRAAIG